MDFTKIGGVLAWANDKGYSPAYALALYSQAQLETGHFSSNIFINALNAFGMRIPKKRRSLRVGEYSTSGNGEFSAYSSVEDSFNDRVLLDEFNGTKKPETFEEIGEYVQEVLRKGYDPKDNRYKDKWQELIQNVYLTSPELNVMPISGFGFKKAAALSGVGLLVGLGLWIFRKKIPILKKLFK